MEGGKRKKKGKSYTQRVEERKRKTLISRLKERERRKISRRRKERIFIATKEREVKRAI